MSLANSQSIAGVTNDAAYTAPTVAGVVQGYGLFPLGSVALLGNTSYTYAQATGGAIAAAGTVALTGGFGTTTGSTYTHDVAAPGVAANQYFWAKKVTTPF